MKLQNSQNVVIIDNFKLKSIENKVSNFLVNELKTKNTPKFWTM